MFNLTINVAKARPNGGFNGVNTGVHRKTKVYITASKRAWTAPNNSIAGCFLSVISGGQIAPPP